MDGPVFPGVDVALAVHGAAQHVGDVDAAALGVVDNDGAIVGVDVVLAVVGCGGFNAHFLVVHDAADHP